MQPKSALLADLAKAVRRWSGDRASIIEATPDQVRATLALNEPIVEDLRRDAVPLTEERVLEVTP